MIKKSTAALTSSQMKIWSGQILNGNDPLYNMILTYEIDGKVDVPRFKKAFQTLVDRNDVFRMIIDFSEGFPEQVFYQEKESTLEFLDFSGFDDSQFKYDSWVEQNKTRVFKTGELLYHAVLFKITNDKFIFYLNQYHLITDGWSMKHVYDELNQYYKGKETENVDINSFENYARLHPFSYDEGINSFWSEKLKDPNRPPPLYGNQLNKTSSNSTRLTMQLGRERTGKLKELALDAEIRAWTIELALSNIFLTMIAALIYKVGNQKNFSVGIPFHNRMNPKEKKIAGLFMELMPVDLEVNENDTLLSLFQKVKNTSYEVSKHVVQSKPPVELLKTFNVLLNYIPMTLDDFGGMPMTCKWILSGNVDPNHHIRLQIQDFNNTGDYQLLFDLNNDVFSSSEIHYVASHFIKIIDAFIEDKNKKLNEISLITEDELERINKWNDTSFTFEESEYILSNFERQVHESADSDALVFGDLSLTYKELDEKSNQVAHYLISQGVQKNDNVAISLDRSLEMVIFIYGILKAGAAYLPLDTNIPINRLKFILNDAQSRFFLINHSRFNLEQLQDFKTCHIDSLMEEIASFSTSRPLINVEPKDLAYIIYTSGSTGEPKGVMCHHEGVCNRLDWMKRDYPITKKDTMILKTPITFDVSVPELFFALQIGAKLVVEKPEGHKNPESLINTILKHNVTVIHFVPSMLNVFLDTEGAGKCQNLRIIFCSGEALTVSSVNKAYSVFENTEVHNLYGPTEASVEVSKWYCVKDPTVKRIPIGHPVANTQLHILDESLMRVPIGVPGQLYIAGKQVTYGYLKRKALTESFFIPDIFSNDSEAKMYKTGDLARYRRDGAIEYLGRIDNQVKLRGLRIELGEIEKTIEKIEKINQVVVQVNQQSNGDDFLVAYYTGEEMEMNDIIESVQDHLPSYMIPTVFKYLDKFELLTSGKVDRKKLPSIHLTRDQKNDSFLEPTSDIEEIILEVWKDILKLNRISTNSNFIQLGGNSLNAMVITSRLKMSFDLESLSISDVFNYPTITKYAGFIEDLILELLELEEQ